MLIRYWPHGKPIPDGWEVINDLQQCHHGNHAVIIAKRHEGASWQTRTAPPEVQALVDAASDVLYHDERGQGQGYADAMDRMYKALAAFEKKEK